MCTVLRPFKMRHELLKKLVSRHVFIVFVLLQVAVIAKAAAPLQADSLTCEYGVNPLGLDVQKPRFSWVLVASERNVLQSAYEIIVSTDSRALQKGKGTAWESKKVMSPQSIQVVYNGKPLQPFTRYY